MLEPRVASRPADGSHHSAYAHSRSRTTSSNAFPMSAQGSNPSQGHNLAPTYAGQRGPIMQQAHTRRSPSVNTFSTSSSFPAPAAFRTSSQTDLRRSISSRSGGTTSAPASGYVALLRKQKATVWCDRAQYEDPRTAHQQKVAKMRANLEVSGGRNSTYGSVGGRTNTGLNAGGKGMVGKIRHHGKTPVIGYAPGENHVGVGGVPLRLSANQVEAESSDEDDTHQTAKAHHRRTGSSGRSSVTSGRRGLAYRQSGRAAGGSQMWSSPGGTPERSGSMVTEQQQQQQQQPSQSQSQQQAGGDDSSASTKAKSMASGSSAERGDNVAELGNAPRLASNSLLNSALTREKSVKNPEELKRRGSVDERTATLTSGRLFIANPD